MEGRTDYDVVIVGASIAGCVAATLLGRAGARVALVERQSDSAAFKRVCGHYIQPSAVPVLSRLGVVEELHAAGAVRGRGRVWSRFGWISLDGRDEAGMAQDDDHRRSLSIRREVLDPLLRRTAQQTPGVDLLPGHTLTAAQAGANGATVRVKRRTGQSLQLRAPLLVGADGRGSRTAELLGVRTRTSRNDRIAYWGYFEGPPLGTGASVHLWFLEPGVGIVTPTDSGLNLYVAFPERSQTAAFKRDPEGSLRNFVAALPDAPPLAVSRRTGPMVGKLDLTNEWRRAAGPGWALVGDAAIAADPVGAIGCGWALQSAAWLADAVGPGLAGDESLSRALRRYRRRHRRELLGHSLAAADGSKARPLNPVERLLFSAAVHDPVTADHVEAFAGRLIRPSRFLAPRPVARAAAVNLRVRRAGKGARREAGATGAA